jgi:hypothetical protein
VDEVCLMSGVPTEPEVRQYLLSRHAPARWAGFLDGLPWRYMRPLVTIAVNAKVHPALALGTAIVHSADQEFRRVGTAHLARKAPADATE